MFTITPIVFQTMYVLLLFLKYGFFCEQTINLAHTTVGLAYLLEFGEHLAHLQL